MFLNFSFIRLSEEVCNLTICCHIRHRVHYGSWADFHITNRRHLMRWTH